MPDNNQPQIKQTIKNINKNNNNNNSITNNNNSINNNNNNHDNTSQLNIHNDQ